MIDSKSGNLDVGDGKVITPSSDLYTIEMMKLGERQNFRGIGNDWSWYDVKNVKIAERYYNISFLFRHQIIHGLSFVFQDKPFDLNLQWESWSEEAERNNNVRFNAWLDAELDHERNFEWGTVSSNFDKKSGFSAIKIKYV